MAKSLVEWYLLYGPMARHNKSRSHKNKIFSFLLQNTKSVNVLYTKKNNKRYRSLGPAGHSRAKERWEKKKTVDFQWKIHICILHTKGDTRFLM
jgi:hypothetical protein